MALPIDYEDAPTTTQLPWRACDVDMRTDVEEVGFVGLEEIPAGSYEIVKLPSGGTIIRSNECKSSKKMSAPRGSSSENTKEQKGASSKRKRKADTTDFSGPSTFTATRSLVAVEKEDREGDSTVASTTASVSASEWAPLGLHAALLAAVSRLGFARPTPIQQRAVPAALSHFKDIVAAAETGSGKTLAFGLPIVHRLLDRRERLGMRTLASPAAASTILSFSRLPALVLTPTRELALQVRDHLTAIAAGTAVRVVAIVGGLAVEKQQRLLKSRPDILIATPGRLWDIMSSGTGGDFLSEMHRLQFLVLDEADRLCERGHFQALNSILSSIQALPPAADEEGGSGAGNERKPHAAAAAAAVASSTAPASGGATGKKQPVAETAAVKTGKGVVRSAAAAETGSSSSSSSSVYPALPADDDADSIPEEEAAAAPAGIVLQPMAIDPPAHYKRQTFLFSATLGLATSQSASEAAKAMVEARSSGSSSGGGAAKLSKKARRRALEAASKLTPVELLMARVGVLGKPEVITLAQTSLQAVEGSSASSAAVSAADSEFARVVQSAASASATDDDAEDADANANSEEDVDGSASVPSSSSTAVRATPSLSSTARTSVALPAGLRLARITVPKGDKNAALYYFLLRFPGRTLIFVNAISTLKRLGALLALLRLPVSTLHAHMQQRQRISALERFRSDPNAILLATDVAARGLDIPAVQFVLHYSLPPSTEVFVHRCGRTARAQTSGLAAALVGPEDQKEYVRICAVLGLNAGLPEFPVDDRYEHAVVARLSLATRIASEEAALNRDSSSQHGLLKLAQDAGLEVDDRTAREAGLLEVNSSNAGAGGEKRRKGAKRARSADGDDAEVEVGAGDVASAAAPLQLQQRQWGDLDDDERANVRHSNKKRARVVKGMRKELGFLLSQSLLPSGVSKRYITANPLLAQAAHPLQRSVVLAPPSSSSSSTAAATSNGGEGVEEDEEDEITPAPAQCSSRSGNALIAGAVAVSWGDSLPLGGGGVVASVAPQQQQRAVRQGGIVGGSTAAEGNALATLARAGKHRHLLPPKGRKT